MKYNDLTRRYFEQAPNAGTLQGEGVLRGSAGDLEEGIRVQFEILAVAGCVRSAGFLAYGCPHTIAVAAWVAEQAIGLILIARLPEPVQQLRDRFEVPPEKLGRLLTIEDAWMAAARR